MGSLERKGYREPKIANVFSDDCAALVRFVAGSTGRRNTLSQAVKDETYDDGLGISSRFHRGEKLAGPSEQHDASAQRAAT
jgi:hypothetical protein